MESTWLIAAAVVLAGLLGFVLWRRCAGAQAAVVGAAALAGCLAVAEMIASAGEETAPAAAKREWKAPPNWPKGHPLPLVESNCASCHLTAGRELTAAVEHYVRSVHDLNDMTCSDCHGGNRENDGRAHEEEFGFIGTKISAHIQTCSDCHSDQVELLAAGPHHWDFSKRVNLEYPTCVDCHGNHDVGNPPADFKLINMCLDCHDDTSAFPNLAEVVKENDRLMDSLRAVRGKRVDQPAPIPAEFAEPLAELRAETMQMVHGSKEVGADDARRLNERVEKIRVRLDEWVKSNQ